MVFEGDEIGLYAVPDLFTNRFLSVVRFVVVGGSHGVAEPSNGLNKSPPPSLFSQLVVKYEKSCCHKGEKGGRANDMFVVLLEQSFNYERHVIKYSEQ